MLRGPLANDSFKGQFSGHETFPLRHLWLGKAYSATSAADHEWNSFTAPDAIITFGVGKNMVSAIRHWALATHIIEECGNEYRTTELGRFLLDTESGRDPYLEEPATTWLLHWLVASTPERTTTWFYAFNHLNTPTFDRETLAAQLSALCDERKWKRVSEATLRRDVECFVRSYVQRGDDKFSDESVEAVLSELGLIRQVGSRLFEFRRGPKPTLPDGVLLFALEDFWRRVAPQQQTLAVEVIAFEPGSPGRVFKLDDFSLVERLARIDESSSQRFSWSDTAGVRSVARRAARVDPLDLLALAYGENRKSRGRNAR